MTMQPMTENSPIILREIPPVIAVPHSVDKVKPVKEVEGIEIQQCLLGTCTNGRLSDFQIAAKILKGKKVHPNVRLLILPASRQIYLDALKEGLIKTFIEAGGTVLPPGCGPCLGRASGRACTWGTMSQHIEPKF